MIKGMFRLILVSQIIFLLTSCYFETMPASKDKPLSDDKAYVYGNFEIDGSSEEGVESWSGAAIILQGIDKKIKYPIAFKRANKNIYVVEVEPGSYSISRWECYVYNTLVPNSNDFESEKISKVFKVEKGNIYYIGDWDCLINYGYSFRINSIRDNYIMTTSELKSKYNMTENLIFNDVFAANL